MFQLQCRAFHNYPGTRLPCSPFGTSDIYRKSSLIRFRKVRLSSIITTNHSKAGWNFYPLRSYGNASQCVFTSHSQLILNSFGPVNSSSLSTYRTFTKRFFSQVKSGMSKRDNIGMQDGKSGGSTFVLQGINKHRKRAMALAAKRKNNATSSSSSQGIDLEASSEVSVGGGKEDIKPGSFVSNSPVSNSKETSKVNGKKKLRNKKSTEQNGDTLLHADAGEGAKGTSRAKKSGNSKTGKDQASKVSKY